MKGTLTKISENTNKLRTNSIDGEFPSYPTPGVSFFIFGKSLELDHPDAVRQVNTSIVQSVKKIDSGIEFTTLNSTYRLENIEGFDA